MTAWMCVLRIFCNDDTNVYGERNYCSQNGVITTICGFIRGCGQYSLALILKVALETAIGVRTDSCGCILCNRRIQAPSGLDAAFTTSCLIVFEKKVTGSWR